MTTFTSFQPQSLLLPPILPRTRPSPSNSLSFNHTTYFGFSNHKHFVRGSVSVVRLGFKPPSSFDFDGAEGLVTEIFRRTEGLLYTLADAAVSVSNVTDGGKPNGDWLSGISNLMETVLKVMKDGLSAVHVPYAYGFAIILLTVLVKAVTFPLTKKQVESAMAMRSLQPQVKAIQKQYAGDQERIQLETARLYKLAGVNPLAGCLPTLATIPVWIGLYRALSNVANEGLLTEGFFWIPSLAGPTTIAAKQNGSGISWLFPFVDGHPPLGWSDTSAYLVLPVLLIISQYISIQIMQSSQVNDPNMKNSQALTNLLPLMIGYFALSVPSGLSLYWFTNNILSTTQQVWLQKLGGAKNSVTLFSDDTGKEVQQKLQKSVTEANSTKVMKSKKEDKSSSEGVPPGERFRQIKEEEARRRQQREEEKKKLVAEKTETVAEEHREELKKVKNGAMHDTSVIGVPNMNSDYSTQGPNGDQPNMPVPWIGDGDLAVDSEVDRKEELHSLENLKKEEAVDMCINTTTKETTVSSENKHDRVEQ